MQGVYVDDFSCSQLWNVDILCVFLHSCLRGISVAGRDTRSPCPSAVTLCTTATRWTRHFFTSHLNSILSKSSKVSAWKSRCNFLVFGFCCCREGTWGRPRRRRYFLTSAWSSFLRPRETHEQSLSWCSVVKNIGLDTTNDNTSVTLDTCKTCKLFDLALF